MSHQDSGCRLAAAAAGYGACQRAADNWLSPGWSGWAGLVGVLACWRRPSAPMRSVACISHGIGPTRLRAALGSLGTLAGAGMRTRLSRQSYTTETPECASGIRYSLLVVMLQFAQLTAKASHPASLDCPQQTTASAAPSLIANSA